MPPKKKKNPADSFQRIKFVGKKAQRLLDEAKTKLKTMQDEQEKKKPKEEERWEDERILVHVSMGSVVKSTLAILGIVLLAFAAWQLRDKLVIFFLAIFLSIVIDPAVVKLERWGLPRGFSVVLVYVVALASLFFLLVSLIPVIAEQVEQMAIRLAETIDAFLADPTFRVPFLGEEINTYLNTFVRQVLADVYTGGVLESFQRFGRDLSTAAQGSIVFVAGVAGSAVEFVAKFVFVLVLCFFFQIQKEGIVRYLRMFLSYRLRRYADTKAEAIREKLGQWIRGQIILSFSIGLLVFIALTVLRMPYALTLAVLAFFLEFIPVVGPLLAALPAVFIAVAQSGPLSALIVALAYYAIQWCENNLLVPLIMQRAVGLSPIAVIFAMFVGISFPDLIHPVLGVLLAVPMAAIMSIFLHDYQEWRSLSED